MGFNFLRHGSLGVFGRRPIAQRAVWSLSIIIKPPSFKFFFHFSQRNKYLGVKKFIAQASIEAFNIAIFYGFAWPDKIQLDAMAISPLIQYFACKLGTIIDGNGLGKSASCSGFLKCRSDFAPTDGRIGQQQWASSSILIDKR